MEKVLATLLGVLMGGLVTWFVAVQRMNYDRKKERRELVLTKYESLHEELENLKAYVGQYTSQLLSELATGEPIQPKELTVGSPSQKINMLIQFYVPELLDKHQYIVKQTKFLHEHFVKHISEPQRTKEFVTESSVMAHELYKAVCTTVEGMQEQLVVLSNKELGNA